MAVFCSRDSLDGADGAHWTVLLDGRFVGRYAAIDDATPSALRFGAEAGPDDHGALWLDDLAVHQRRIGSQVRFDDDMNAVSLDWAGYNGTTVSQGSAAPYGSTLRVESTKSDPARANQSLTTDETDLSWTFAYRLESSNADGTDAATASTILEGRDAAGATVWGLRLVDERTVAVFDDGAWVVSDLELGLEEWSLLEVARGPTGYRVWNSTLPVSANGANVVFGTGSGEPVARIFTGGGAAVYDLASVRAFQGERPLWVTFARAEERWQEETKGSGSAGKFDIESGSEELPAGLEPPSVAPAGNQSIYASTGSAADEEAFWVRSLPLPERFSFAGWIWPGGLVSDYDGMSMAAFANQTGEVVLDVRLVPDVDDLAVEIATPSGVSSTSLRVPVSDWTEFTVDLEQSTGAFVVRIGTDVYSGELGLGHELGAVFLGDTKRGTSPSGAGSAVWDHLRVQTLNGRPVVDITSLVADEVVSGPFWVNGTIQDELVDRVSAIRVVPGDEPQVNPALARVFAQELDPSGWVSGDWYWIKVTAEDDSTFGRDVVRVCYDAGGVPCTAGATEHGSGSGETENGVF